MDLEGITLSSSIYTYSTEAAMNSTPELDEVAIIAAYCPTAVWIDKVVTPFWYVLGITGNIISAFIWLQRRMRNGSSSAIYLSSLSISDTVFLLLHMLFELHLVWDVRTLDYPGVCETFAVSFLVSQYLAPVLVLCFTVDRFIAVRFPFRKVFFCTVRRALYVVLGLVFACFSLGSIQAYLWTYDGERCTVRQEALKGDDASLWKIWSWLTEMLIFLVVPIAVLIVNILVILEIRVMPGDPISATTTIVDTAAMDDARRSSGGPSIVSSFKAWRDGGSPRNGETNGRSASLASMSKTTTTPDLTASMQEMKEFGRTDTPLLGEVASKTALIQLDGVASRRTTIPLIGIGRAVGNGADKRRKSMPSASNAATHVMLLTVSFYLIVMTLPATLVYITQPGSTNKNITTEQVPDDPSWNKFLLHHCIKRIVDEICISHYACNLLLFLATGERFRAAFLALFKPRRKTGRNSNGRFGKSTDAKQDTLVTSY